MPGKSVQEIARVVAAGRYLPALVVEDGVFRARWLPREVDAFVRRAGRGLLEDPGKYETAEDAWLAALRTDSGRVQWPNRAELAELKERLDAWRAALAADAAAPKTLKFRLEPEWRIVYDPPKTRLGLLALGQAVRIFPPLGRADALTFADAEAFVRRGAAALAAAGFETEFPEGLCGEHVEAVASLDSGTGRSQCVRAKIDVRVDGEKVTAAEIRFLLEQGSTLVFFRNRWIEVDRNVLREALKVLEKGREKKLGVAESLSWTMGLGRAGRMRVKEAAAHGWLRGLLNELRGDDAFAILKPPRGLKAKLRDYQRAGYSYLAFLTKWGFGACLADDMGLGKTVQTIAWILRRRALAATPVLVVAPTTVTTNWMREFGKFAPSLKVMLHQGPDRLLGDAFRRAAAKCDVAVTSYALLVKDFRFVAKAGFGALVLDEAQAVKNPDTQSARAARALPVSERVALTGTPFENSALDLWSMQEFLNPGLLGARADFVRDFVNPIRTDASSAAATRLRRILAPFVLRRLKTDPGVAAELGAKREIREYCALSPAQRRDYEAALVRYRNDVAADAGNRSGRALALLTELKLACDGFTDGGEWRDDSGKAARLDELLDGIFGAGESALVFTQYAKAGAEIRRHLEERFGRRMPYLHGGLSLAERTAEIEAFNAAPEPTAFVLSLRAGGVGLNLTRATHVIHYDRWWNPAVENQATDRAHRIGQPRDVFVHLFVAAGTVEDRVDAIIESKRQIAGEVVVAGESFLLKMGEGDFAKVVELAP
ncbi:MAG: DEAD/DEAH box helicase [Kiritimatiellae bacterium]|nr:DEAD/DEAH box helicase [Kiritimatiellia bacterium]